MKNKEESKVMHCPKCNEVVSINGCTWVEKMCVAYKTYKEVNSRIGKEILKQGMMKNGIIQGLHKQIGKLLDMMTEEQREEARGLTQEMRDFIRSWEKKK